MSCAPEIPVGEFDSFEEVVVQKMLCHAVNIVQKMWLHAVKIVPQSVVLYITVLYFIVLYIGIIWIMRLYR